MVFFFLLPPPSSVRNCKRSSGNAGQESQKSQLYCSCVFCKLCLFSSWGPAGKEGGAARSSKSLLWGCYLSACAIT